MQSPTSAVGTSAHATSAEPARTAVKVMPAPRRKEILKESSQIVKKCTPTLLWRQAESQNILGTHDKRHPRASTIRALRAEARPSRMVDQMNRCSRKYIPAATTAAAGIVRTHATDRKSTRLNSSHVAISYA